MSSTAAGLIVEPLGAPAVAGRIRLLCVDDEPNVLASLAPHLRRRCEMLTATNGAAALELLRAHDDIAVIISDMRMPGMDGASFLAKAREVAPAATRVLLTGQTDLATAVAAVNEGRVFRFLTKPCAPAQLIAAVEAAAEQHRLVTAERVLLEKTLHGSIRALTDVLALTNPLAFGRGARVKQLVTELAARIGLRDRWQVEVAAMLSQLCAISLPMETVERVYYGHPLGGEDLALIASAATATEQLLENIPRLELVREMLARLWNSRGAADLPTISQRSQVEVGVALLRIASDFDVLEAQGYAPAFAIETLRGQSGRHRPEVLGALGAVRGDGQVQQDVQEMPLAAVRIGMVFADDVKLTTGALLVPRGYEVTPSLIERVRTFRPGAIKGLVRVVVNA